jgi:hypothetical protein
VIAYQKIQNKISLNTNLHHVSYKWRGYAPKWLVSLEHHVPLQREQQRCLHQNYLLEGSIQIEERLRNKISEMDEMRLQDWITPNIFI